MAAIPSSIYDQKLTSSVGIPNALPGLSLDEYESPELSTAVGWDTLKRDTALHILAESYGAMSDAAADAFVDAEKTDVPWLPFYAFVVAMRSYALQGLTPVRVHDSRMGFIATRTDSMSWQVLNAPAALQMTCDASCSLGSMAFEFSQPMWDALEIVGATQPGIGEAFFDSPAFWTGHTLTKEIRIAGEGYMEMPVNVVGPPESHGPYVMTLTPADLFGSYGYELGYAGSLSPSSFDVSGTSHTVTTLTGSLSGISVGTNKPWSTITLSWAGGAVTITSEGDEYEGFGVSDQVSPQPFQIGVPIVVTLTITP